MLEEELQKTYSSNYFVATVDMEDNYVDNMISRMQAAGKASGDVICHPLMSIAGDHANNDMKGGVSENDPRRRKLALAELKQSRIYLSTQQL